MTRHYFGAATAASFLMLCMGSVGSAQDVPGATSAGSESLQEIVVTSKRMERAQDVPTAVSTLGSSQIETLGIESFKDYEGLVPSLSQRDEGAPGIGTIILRGLNTGSEQSANTAGYYLDDTPFSASGFSAFADQVTPDPDLLDVDHIEVLKGPQGTLFGAGSLGGLIRIITKKPSLTEFSGSVTTEGDSVDGGGGGYSVRGSVTDPLIQDVLGVRAAAFYRHNPGFTDNLGTGTKNVNDGTEKGARIALLARPTSALSIELDGFVQDTTADGFDYQYNKIDTAVPLYGVREFKDFFNPSATANYRLASLKLDYDLSTGTVTADVGYGSFTAFRINDWTDQNGPVPGFPANGGVAQTTGPGIDKFSTEVRFVSKRLGRIEFLIGLFDTVEHNRIPFLISGLDRDTLAPLPEPNYLLFGIHRHSLYEESAAFGDLTYYFTNDLDFTGGVRYARNTEHTSDFFYGAFVGPPSVALYDFNGSATTYLATLRWRPTSALSPYLRVASGYRPGGPQLNSIVPPGAQKEILPDTVWNYEAGVKGNFFDGRVNSSFDVYHIDWKHVQLNSTCCGGFIFEGNAGAAAVDGVELELQARPIKPLKVGFSMGYTNARITEISAATSATIGAAAGDALPLTPRYTAALTGDYTYQISGGLEGNLGSTVRYEGTSHSSYPGNLINPDVIVPSYVPIDIRAGLHYAKYLLQFRVENITNRDGYTTIETAKAFPNDPMSETIASVIRPRTFILSLTTDF